MTPKYVKPYVKRGKNDAVDAEAICEAVTRPTMRFVAVKSVDQQSVLMIHRTRSLLIRQRTMLVNALRGHLAELGIVAETPDGGDARDYAAGDEFLRVGANKARVTQSEVIGSPSNTIIQGTLIEATLETAISSQLPGDVAANVSYDVWSMDMSQVLIPRGSKLYGRYNSQIERGQRRVMIAWDRLVTADGQSVQLEGYGTDRIGRAGMTGKQ